MWQGRAHGLRQVWVALLQPGAGSQMNCPGWLIFHNHQSFQCGQVRARRVACHRCLVRAGDIAGNSCQGYAGRHVSGASIKHSKKGRKQTFNGFINIYLINAETHYLHIRRQTFDFSGVCFGVQLLDLRGATPCDHGYQRVHRAQRGRVRLALEDYGFLWRNSTKRQEMDLEPGEPPKYGGRIAMVRCGRCEAGCLN